MNRKSLFVLTLSLVMVLGAGSGGDAGLPDRTPSGLTVASEPPATLIVDGIPRGETPLALADLPPGEHRFRLVKIGYQAIVQTVDLAPGATGNFSFSLRPSAFQASDARAGKTDEKAKATAGEKGSKKKGSKLKWIVPAVLVAGGGTAAAMVVSNKNAAPQAGLSVAPTAAGMAGLTVFRFDGGQSSDPDGNPLSYAWNFGDSTTAYGQSPSHMYSTAGTYYVSLTVYDGRAMASAGGTARVNHTLAGVWKGRLRDNYDKTFNMTLSLNQSGTSLLGNYADESGTGSAYGSISGADYVCPCPVNITVRQAGFQPFTISGTVDASISMMSVSVRGSGFRGETFTLTLTN